MKRSFGSIILAMIILIVPLMSACGAPTYAESGQVIIEAKELASFIGQPNTVIVDMQAEDGYAAGHVEGAVNIQCSSILTNLPVENMLASKGKINSVMGEAGIGKDTQVIIYDEGKSLNASRLWWTLLTYGHENAKVVSGGFSAIQKAGIKLTTEQKAVTPAEFEAEDKRSQYVADMRSVIEQVNEPDQNVVLLDNRSVEEYEADGKVPGSLIYPHTKNFYKDGELLDVQATRINFLEQGIKPDKQVIMYCRTSMRSATTFLILYNAGYRNLKMYDGAFLEWSISGNNPVERPSGAPVPASPRDNS